MNNVVILLGFVECYCLKFIIESSRSIVLVPFLFFHCLHITTLQPPPAGGRHHMNLVYNTIQYRTSTSREVCRLFPVSVSRVWATYFCFGEARLFRNNDTFSPRRANVLLHPPRPHSTSLSVGVRYRSATTWGLVW